ncbi:MAG TPA: hypothetical protein VMU80_19895 [Bryobacteraceae bacterium]|nr:hypothetical protein [Bryobacteraceae bacterium]
MHYSPLLLLHISGGTAGLLSGAVALSLRKGSRAHGIAGHVFFVSMLTMSSVAVFLALMKHEASNVIGGTLTFYMVATAWVTARRRDGETSPYDWLGFVAAAATGTVILTFAFQAAKSPTGSANGVPAPMYFFFSAVALLGAAGDLRMLLRGGLFGVQRIARHLWRMCFALFASSASIFIARPHLFPAFMQRTGMLLVLGILPLLMMIFWLIRVRFVRAFQRKPLPPVGVVRAVQV